MSARGADTGGLRTFLSFVYWDLPDVLPVDPHSKAIEYSPELADWTPIEEER